MKKMKIFCFGFGQVAKNFIKRLNEKKIKFQLIATSRDKTKIKEFDGIKYQSFKLDENNFDTDLVKKLEESDHILISIPPVNNSDLVLKKFKNYLVSKDYKWITYLSATSVYGNHNGKWVDEESLTNPTSANGLARLNSENEWLEISKANNLPLQIFRLSGIYSNQYNLLKRLKSGDVKIVDIKNHFFSRIHVEDIASALFKSLNYFKKDEIYNISDDKPASNEEIAKYGVKLLKIKMPPTIKIEDIENDFLKNFYLDSKRVSNKKMKKCFNLSLKYPSYIEGLNYIKNNFI